MSSVPLKPIAIDLFCGSGAVSEGLKQAGFQVIAGVDFDETACATYRANHPEVHLVQGDISTVNPIAMREALGCKGSIDLLLVCAPCQPFSNQNSKKKTCDPRKRLVLECVKFAKEFTPKTILFENVRGIAAKGPLQELREQLQGLGYHLSEPLHVDAANLGVPQRRERCVMLASPDQQILEDFPLSITAQPKVTVHEAIGHLASLAAGEKDPVDPLHFARQHKAITLQRLKLIPKNGGSRSALPYELTLKCHRGKKKTYPDIFGRLCWEDVAPTLTTGCTDVTKGRYTHPEDDRAITLREAALLQSFPKNYRFCGNSGQIAKQIGNAVPVQMMYNLALAVRRCQHYEMTTTASHGELHHA
jgi:DNA (cytosine-5)-methyltransferase 1